MQVQCDLAALAGYVKAVFFLTCIYFLFLIYFTLNLLNLLNLLNDFGEKWHI